MVMLVTAGRAAVRGTVWVIAGLLVGSAHAYFPEEYGNPVEGHQGPEYWEVGQWPLLWLLRP